MTLSFFRTVKSTLDQALEAYCDKTGIEHSVALVEARHYLRQNSQAYFDRRVRLEYEKPLCRLAYLYTYVPAHANIVDYSFRQFKALQVLIEDCLTTEETLKICSLGGGPGSELLGLLKYVERTSARGTVNIHFTLLDKYKEWDETWHALEQDICAQFRTIYGRRRADWPASVNHAFLPVDLTSKTDFANMPTRFRGVSLFVINFAMSELLDQVSVQELVDSLRTLVQQCDDSAYFLFIDRLQDEIETNVAVIIHQLGLVLVEVRKQQEIMDGDEQASDLGDWFTVRMDRYPKIKLNAFHVLAQKPTANIPF